MYTKKSFSISLIILFSITLLVLLISFFGKIYSIPFITTLFAPIQRAFLESAQQIKGRDESTLKKENEVLQQEIVHYKTLEKEDGALRDQFQTASVPTMHLLPVHIIGEPGFIPGQTSVEDFFIDQGSQDGVKTGMAVIYKNNLLGKVTQTTAHISHVVLVSNVTVSFAAKTIDTNALGVMRGQGGGDMILDNVTLSQTLKTNDLVTTSGDVDIHGLGYPPNLTVGKIISVQKDPSALFQRANVVSLIDITKVAMVFVMTEQ